MSVLPLGDITSANSTIIMRVEGLFPAGVPLMGFATDQSLSQDEITIAETRMGVDGNFVAGWVPSIKPVTIMLEASSPSAGYMLQLYQHCEQRRGIYEVSLVCTIPSILRIITWSKGVLKSGTVFPDHRRALEPTTWRFEFADMASAAL